MNVVINVVDNNIMLNHCRHCQHNVQLFETKVSNENKTKLTIN